MVASKAVAKRLKKGRGVVLYLHTSVFADNDLILPTNYPKYVLPSGERHAGQI